MDAYDGMSLCGGLVFFAPVALLVRTQAGISETQFFLLQALLSGIIALGELPTGHLTDRMGYRRSPDPGATAAVGGQRAAAGGVSAAVSATFRGGGPGGGDLRLSVLRNGQRLSVRSVR
ncbi:MAG: hypothetical protein V8S97_02675 [Oscillospiraceae bacterium]